MIRLLRQRHRQAWMVVAPAGLVLIGLSVALRPDQAVVQTMPAVLRQPQASQEGLATEVPGIGSVARALVSGAPGVVLHYEEALRVPDPLLYWSAGSATPGLPADAVLVGALEGRDRDQLPLDQQGGYLSIFSLGHGEVVASFPLPEASP